MTAPSPSGTKPKPPKLYFTEIGLVSNLLGISSASQVAGNPLVGALFEKLAVIEALKECYNNGLRSNLYYFRASHGFEIDLIVDEGRRPRPVEIKSTMKLSESLLHQADNVRNRGSRRTDKAAPAKIRRCRHLNQLFTLLSCLFTGAYSLQSILTKADSCKRVAPQANLARIWRASSRSSRTEILTLKSSQIPN